MLSKYVKVGDKLELESIEDNSEKDELIDKKNYRSQVYDIVSEDQIKIAMPMEQGKVVLLPVDGEYNICFYAQSGLYQCLARVIDRYKTDNIFILVMELTTDIRKYQRREYYRLNCVLDMKVREVLPAERLFPIVLNKYIFWIRILPSVMEQWLISVAAVPDLFQNQNIPRAVIFSLPSHYL